EPVAALDPVNRDRVLGLVAELTSQGVATLSVFHDLEAVRRLATRVVALRDGEVVADASPREVLEQVPA
ncbi:MAG: cobalt ABC transporter ATP-binding protein, partial [Acidimicrobiaceae bacterium]|nr:cobalt ABC transporter ATP-binding protein [Acidimicrobiaceae bacterium]